MSELCRGLMEVPLKDPQMIETENEYVEGILPPTLSRQSKKSDSRSCKVERAGKLHTKRGQRNDLASPNAGGSWHSTCLV